KMRTMLIYFLTFLAVILPVMWYQILSDRKPRSDSPKEDSEPFLFRVCRGPASILTGLGIGSLFRRIFPVVCREQQKKLNYAGLRTLTPSRIFCTKIVLMIFCSCVAGGIIYMIVNEEDRQLSSLVAGLIGAFVAWFLPGIVIGNKVEERKTKILRALPFSIDLITSAMRGGLDFSAAIRFYVKLGIPGPLTEEYRTMLQEMELGVIRTAALQNMAGRIQIKDFTSFASAVVMGSELGASLADTMEVQSEEMRKLRFSIAECKAQRAPSLMLIPMALFILPAVFIVILTPVFLKMKEAGVPLF
ncbi:MAG: type II secretion system F family protein, partial [Lentisphaeria bacterium]|nr:type II secretion system F family protein [Lentisphaeria bacterium]